MLGAGLKDIKNPRYNERGFPVPWDSDIGVPPTQAYQPQVGNTPISRPQLIICFSFFTGFVFRRSSLGQRADGGF